MCERIRASIAEPMEPLEGAFLTQTVSLGVATWDGMESAEQVEARARSLLAEGRLVGPDQLRA